MESAEEQKILKLCLTKKFYTSTKIHKGMFDSKLHQLLACIDLLHGKFEGDLDIGVLYNYYYTNSAESETRKEAVKLILDQLKSVKKIPIDQAQELLHTLEERDIRKNIVQKAFDTNVTLDEVKTYVANLDISEDAVTDEIPTDLDELYADKASVNPFTFPLKELQAKVTGIGRGHNVAVFARTEMGKSTFTTHLAGHWIKEGHKVVYFCNEEPGRMIMERIIQGVFNLTKEEFYAKKDTLTFKKKWKRISKNLTVRHNTDLDISDVNSYCASYRPDICILDQTDNIAYHGDKSKNTERIGLLWQECRNIASRHQLAMVNVTQASAEAEGHSFLTDTMGADSKTDKPAALDLYMGIGILNEQGGRCISLCKNKIGGNHKPIYCRLDAERARYVA